MVYPHQPAKFKNVQTLFLITFCPSTSFAGWLCPGPCLPDQRNVCRNRCDTTLCGPRKDYARENLAPVSSTRGIYEGTKGFPNMFGDANNCMMQANTTTGTSCTKPPKTGAKQHKRPKQNSSANLKGRQSYLKVCSAAVLLNYKNKTSH